MDRAAFIHKRRGRYLAQILEGFEQTIEPHLPAEAAPAVTSFKAMVRVRLGALSRDAADLMDLEGVEVNGVAQEIRDRLHTLSRP